MIKIAEISRATKVKLYVLTLTIMFSMNLNKVLKEEYHTDPFPSANLSNDSNNTIEQHPEEQPITTKVILEPLNCNINMSTALLSSKLTEQTSQYTSEKAEKNSTNQSKKKKSKKKKSRKKSNNPSSINNKQETSIQKQSIQLSDYNEDILTPKGGINYNRNGYLETYYNLDMSLVVSNMRDRGFPASEYPYWVRSDGVKMLGDYVMVAADLNIHPRGSLVHTSLGTGIVCDTGEFTETNSYQFDIAVSW